MKDVTVSKVRLKSILTENKKTHEEDFEIAWEAYAKKVKKNLEQLLDAAKKAPKGTEIKVHVNLQAPRLHKDDYERAIEMLDWELGDQVVLLENEFEELVMDQWGWKGIVAASNAFYTGSASPSKK